MQSLFAWLNWQTVQAGIRHVVQWGSGLLVANGAISSDQQQLLIGAVLSVAAFVWSIVDAKSNKGAQDIKKAVVASPVDVKDAVIDHATSPKSRTTIIDVLEKAFDRK